MPVPPRDQLVLTASRRIPADVRRVWHACTEGSKLERWWSPEDLETTVRRLEARPGGQVLIRIRYSPALVTADGAEAFRAAGIPITFDLRGALREVIPERLLVFDLTLDLGRAGAGIEMVTRLDFTPEGDATLVRIEASGSKTPHWASLGQQNLEAQLARLSAVATESP